MCYQLVINVDSIHKQALIEKLLQNDISDFVEGSVEFEGVYPDGDETFDPSGSFDSEGDRSPIVLFREDKEDFTRICQIVEEGLPNLSGLKLRLEEVEAESWKDSWKESFKPITVSNNVVILPPWENLEHYPSLQPLFIDPGMAFGTGQHETTQVCMEIALESELFNCSKKVLDVGTGSGILAILAALKGMTHVCGIDIEEDSIAIAKENARLNNCSNIRFSMDRLTEFQREEFEVIFANVQFKPLVELTLDIHPLLKKDSGRLIISGILKSEMHDFVNLLKCREFDIIEKREKGDWVGFLCKNQA